MNIYGPKYRVFFVAATGKYTIGIYKNGIYIGGVGEFLTEKDANKGIDVLVNTTDTSEERIYPTDTPEYTANNPPKRRIRKLIV